MKKRIPLYDLIYRLDSKEKIFIKKYLSENLNASSKKIFKYINCKSLKNTLHPKSKDK